MKKYIKIIFTLTLLLSLIACHSSGKKITLPEPEKISEIEIMKNTSENGAKITEQDEISEMIREIKENTKSTGKESINDQPVNIDDYIIIKFIDENAEVNPEIAYLYKDKNMSYIEQPYSGIWKLKKEIYEDISSNVIKSNY